MPSNKTPPVIDFGDFLSGDEKRMKHCADQIREACLTQGFFQIVNHDIPLSLQKEMFAISKEFFALPTEEKMKLDKSKNRYNRGYEVMHGQMIEASHFKVAILPVIRKMTTGQIQPVRQYIWDAKSTWPLEV